MLNFDWLITVRFCHCLCPCVSAQSASEYFSQQQESLAQAILTEEKRARSKPIGLAFVTFR